MARTVDFIVGIGWIVFWVYWVAMAVRTHGQAQARTPRGAGIRLLLVAIVILTIRALPQDWGQAHRNPYLLGGGLVVYVLGLALAIWARVYLGNSWGFPGDKQTGTELVTSGPYRFVRHPIYTGILAAMLGTAAAVTSYWLIVTLAFGVYFIGSAAAEEKYLITVFPKAYPDYIRRTRMLIPFVL